jgi:hypothetical protein
MLRVICLIFLTAFAVQAQERTNEQLKQQAKHFKNSKRFVISYDKFKDQTLIKTGPFAVSGTARYMAGGGFIFLSAGFLFEGQVLKQSVAEFDLILEHHGNEWQFLDTTEMYLLIDGRREILKTERDASTHRGGFGSMGVTSEILLVKMSPELFESISTAKSVELRAGSYETKLKEEHQQGFRDLLSLARNEPGKP